jgi:SagB-type dehydrogenase family enzyme
MDETIRQYRAFMKSNYSAIEDVTTDQMAGKPVPPLEKTTEDGQPVVELPAPDASVVCRTNVHECIKHRRSERQFWERPLSLAELSYLLWATQGVAEVVSDGKATLRTVPSGGARHPFETYLLIHRVSDLEPGVYRYQPVEHQLVPLRPGLDWVEPAVEAAYGQRFVGEGAAVFVWSCIPYRGEWRYHVAAHKVMLIDAGHVCQNLYLACEAVCAHTCAIAAYDQKAMDALLGLDGEDEFVVYLAPVGKSMRNECQP